MDTETNTTMSVNEPIVNKQRVVNKALGKNITKDHTRIYDEIEKKNRQNQSL